MDTPAEVNMLLFMDETSFGNINDACFSNLVRGKCSSIKLLPTKFADYPVLSCGERYCCSCYQMQLIAALSITSNVLYTYIAFEIGLKAEQLALKAF